MVGIYSEDESANKCFTECQKTEENEVGHASPGKTCSTKTSKKEDLLGRNKVRDSKYK